jgi:hypothetical protein
VASRKARREDVCAINREADIPVCQVAFSIEIAR